MLDIHRYWGAVAQEETREQATGWPSEILRAMSQWKRIGTVTAAQRKVALGLNPGEGPDHRRNGPLARQVCESARVFWTCRSETQVADEVARLAANGVAEHAVVHVVEGQAVRLMAAAHETSPEQAERFAATQHSALVLPWSLEVVRDVWACAEPRVLPHPDPSRTWMVVPLLAGTHVLGVLSLRGLRTSAETVAVFAGLAGASWEGVRTLHAQEQSARKREELLTMLSHDLRNAITTVLLRADMLQRRLLDRGDVATSKRAVHEILSTGSWMEQLIQDMLTVRALDGGRVKLRPQRRSAAELVRRAAEMLEPVAEARRMRLHVVAPAHLAVNVDEARALQVLTNLVGNALKFSPEGGVVSLRVEASGEDVILTVSDRGPGIPASEVPHIFDPWWRGVAVEASGCGLGLSIAKALVELHGGRIWVESTPGAGTTFCVTLPAA